MSGLPRQDLPVGLRRYDPGHAPKRRARVYVGRTNRLEDEAQLLRTVEAEFVERAGRLTVGEQQVRCGFRSHADAKETTRARRHIASTLGRGSSRGVDGPGHRGSSTAYDESPLQPPPSPPPTPPKASLAFRKGLADAAVHPTAATLARENAYGKGHRTDAENFFLRGATSDGGYTAPPAGDGSDRYRTFGKQPFLLSSRLPVVAAGGGQLEYNDPVRDEYSRNPVVARFDIRQVRAYQEATGDRRDTARMPWEEEREYEEEAPAAAASVAHHGAGDRPAREGGSAVTTPQAERPTTPALSVRSAQDAESIAEGVQPHDSPSPPGDERGQAEPLASSGEGTAAARKPPSRPPRDAWIQGFKPSVDPYKVEPFKGRCGCSDFRLTFQCVQPEASSAMHAPPAAYRSVARVPLDTPNTFQLHQRGRKRFEPSQ